MNWNGLIALSVLFGPLILVPLLEMAWAKFVRPRLARRPAHAAE